MSATRAMFMAIELSDLGLGLRSVRNTYRCVLFNFFTHM